MKFQHPLTQEIVQELFHYDPKGFLVWKRNRLQNHAIQGRMAGKRFGTVTGEGYRQGKVDGKQYKCHRLIYLYHYGYFTGEIDHINNEKNDNRIENLRVATRNQNACNYATQNKNGFRGVVKMRNQYAAFIRNKKTKIYLGLYKTAEKAARAYDKAAEEYHGEFATKNNV